MATSGSVLRLNSNTQVDIESIFEDESLNTLEELGSYVLKAPGKKEKIISCFAEIITHLIFSDLRKVNRKSPRLTENTSK